MTAAQNKSSTRTSKESNAQTATGSQPPAEDTRERLVRTATGLFAKRGLDGVSVKELADSAGVNVSLVSYHFGGKENLYRACLEQFGQARLAVAQRVLQIPRSADDLRVRLQLFIEEMFACHLENLDTAQLIHRECEADLPVAPEVFRNTFLKIFETMITFFKGAQDLKILRPDLDPVVITHLIFGGIKHVAHSDKLSKRFFGLTIADEGYRRKMIDHILQCTMFGVVENERSTP